MISAAGIKDQELAIIAEGPGVNHPSVARGCDLAAWPGGDGKALLGAADAVRSAKIADFDPIHRQRQHSLGGCEGNRRAQPPGIPERGEVGPAFAPVLVTGPGRRACRPGRGIETLAELDDKLIEALGLAAELRGTRALLAERLLRLRLPPLTRIDHQRQPLPVVGD